MKNQGILAAVKPEGITSFQFLYQFKKIFQTKKIGHTGTLDKFAHGLMIITVGRATRLSQWIVLADKRYRARIKFGTETDTLDPEGSIINTRPLPSAEVNLDQIVKQFIGVQDQIPPEYSAIHIDGKRAYERVNAGEVLEMPARKIEIFSLEVVNFTQEFMDIDVHCGKGTYIRSLARDLSYALGSCGHLVSLERVSVGALSVEGAYRGEGEPQFLSLPELRAILGHPQLMLADPAQKYKIQNGQALEIDKGYSSDKPLLIIDQNEEPLAIFEYDMVWRSRCVLSNES